MNLVLTCFPSCGKGFDRSINAIVPGIKRFIRKKKIEKMYDKSLKNFQQETSPVNYIATTNWSKRKTEIHYIPHEPPTTPYVGPPSTTCRGCRLRRVFYGSHCMQVLIAYTCLQV